MQNLTALEPAKGGGHHHEVAGAVEVERLNDFELVHICISDGCNRNVSKVDALTANQKQKKVERTIVRWAAHGGHEAEVRHGVLGRVGEGSSGEQAGGGGGGSMGRLGRPST